MPGSSQSTLSKFTIGRFDHLLRCTPIVLLNDLGPIVLSSKVLKKYRDGNSFKCKRQTTHCSSLFICCSIKRITPVLEPVLITVPSHPKTSKVVQEKTTVYQMRDNSISDVFAELLKGVMWPIYTDLGSCIIK